MTDPNEINDENPHRINGTGYQICFWRKVAGDTHRGWIIAANRHTAEYAEVTKPGAHWHVLARFDMPSEAHKLEQLAARYEIRKALGL